MWQQRSSVALIPAYATPVPDAGALRQAVLSASWKRSQQVARRRLAWRWFLWCFPRYLLPLFVLLASATWVWYASQSAATTTVNHAPSPTDTRDTTVTTSLTSDPRIHAGNAAENDPLWSPPLGLRLERSLDRSKNASTAANQTYLDTADQTETVPVPLSIKAEIWLHSQEP